MKKLFLGLILIFGVLIARSQSQVVMYRIDTTMELSTGVNLDTVYVICKVYTDQLQQYKLGFDTYSYVDTLAYQSGKDYFTLLSETSKKRVGGVDYKTLTQAQLINMDFITGKYKLVIIELLAEALEIDPARITAIDVNE